MNQTESIQVAIACAMLAQLNDAVNKRDWWLRASTDGKTFQIEAEKDVPCKKTEAYLIGEVRMTAAQLLCTVAALLSVEFGCISDDMTMIEYGAVEDYREYVLNQKNV